MYIDDGTFDQFVDSGNAVKVASKTFLCADGGNTILVRKDRPSLLKWWNKGFKVLKDNGAFKTLCNAANKNYGKKLGFTPMITYKRLITYNANNVSDCFLTVYS